MRMACSSRAFASLAFATAMVVAPGAPPGSAASALPCGRWTIAVAPVWSHARSYLGGVAAVSVEDGWAVGWYSASAGSERPLIEHWNGDTWQAVPNPDPGSEGYLSAVAAASTSDAWAVGYLEPGEEEKRPLIEHWDGRSWTIVRIPDLGESVLTGVAAVTPSDAWAVGWQERPSGGRRPLIERWDGATWRQVEVIESSAGTNVLFAVAAVSSTDVWAVGRHSHPSSDLIMHWDGQRWNEVRGAGYGRLLGMGVLDANDIWAVGRHPVVGTFHTLIEHWDGAAWSVVASPNKGHGFNVLYGVAGSRPDDVWAVGDADGVHGNENPVLVEHWDGSTWSIVDAPGGSRKDNDLEAVSALPSGDLWAVGYTGRDFAPHALIERYCPAGPRLVGGA
jgi:hypothetical protein